jgi:Na+/H+ antiporter NhaD/arsenite permease-like protein
MSVPHDQRPIVLAIFILTYAGLAIGRIPGLKVDRGGIALLGAIAMMICAGSTTTTTIALVNWPTIFLLFGFFVISAQLQMSGFYDRVAENISGRLEAPVRFLILLIAVTAALSAFLNNDVVCYVLAPVVGPALVRKRLDPVPFLVALAVASNIGAGATLIGNAQNIMIGQLAGLSFLRYILWSLVPVLFGLLATYAVTRAGARPGPAVLPAVDAVPVATYVFDLYHTIKGLVILGAVIALFFTALPKEVIVLVAVGIHLVSAKFGTEELLSLVDWQILVLFMALFVVSGTFQATGYGGELVHWLQGLGFEPTLPLNEVALTAGLTALINNAPAVMLLVKLLPITKVSVAYIMALANSFGGGLILTSSVANLIVVQQARRQGITISFGAFARYGVPITLAALAGLVGWAYLASP